VVNGGRAFVRAEASDAPHVGRIQIDKGEYGNAFTVDMCRQFVTALATLESDDRIKVILVSATGDDLSTGLDPAEVGTYHERVVVPGDRIPSLRARLRAADEYFWGREGLYSRLLATPKVTVIAANGWCHDVGLYLTLFCDIAVAGAGARFANPRWQHVGVDGDVSMLLATVGRKRANELMFAGAEWSSQQALAAGLVNLVSESADAGDAAIEVARTVSTIMRDGIAAEKYLTAAATEKMGIGAGFATATMMTAMSSTIHFRPGEFNFLQARRDLGLAEALEQAQRAKNPA
jgi:enoyl-CoA hydratase/carnithine racemase